MSVEKFFVSEAWASVWFLSAFVCAIVVDPSIWSQICLWSGFGACAFVC